MTEPRSTEGGSGGWGDQYNDPFGGPKNPQQNTAQKKLQQTQAQVDEVVGIMKLNVEKVLERDQKLSELDNRADAVLQAALEFEQQTLKLKRKYWWKNFKMIIIMCVIGVVLLTIIILLAVYGSGSSETPAKPALSTTTSAPSS